MRQQAVEVLARRLPTEQAAAALGRVKLRFHRRRRDAGANACRVTSPHPKGYGDDLVEAYGRLPKLAESAHLPVQSGSDAILHAMNRKHSARDYFDLVNRIREARPDIALSSDFIVGFPGETDADFQDTMRLVREVRFASAFSFMYSKRPGTPGAELPDQTPEEIKKKRLHELQAELERQKDEFNASFAGARLPVLFEKPGRHAGQIVGRTPYMQSVHVMGPASLIGTIQTVAIEQQGPNSLKGRLIERWPALEESN